MSDWAVILGASSGIGAACAKELASKGMNIFGVYLRKPKDHIQALSEELESYGVKVVFKKMSATNEEKRKDAIDELKSLGDIRVKVFVHSLAFGTLKPIFDSELKNTLNQKNIEMTLDVMANSLIYWAQDLYNGRLLKKGSQIFGMTSSGGHRQWKAYGAISMAKAGLESASRQLAFELAPSGIASNTIQAGVTDTPALRKIPNNESMIEKSLSMNPNGRLTLPEDVAHVVSMLGRSEESWLTGNNIRVDGGEDITG
jgi:enoyl-[acyl-carrier protein] reductase III